MDSATQTTPPSAPPPPQPAGAPSLNYASTAERVGGGFAERVRIGFLMRFVAAIIDGIIANVLARVVIVVFGILHLPWLGAILGGVLALAYYSLEVLKARSLGKMLFQYTITAQDGSPATRDQLLKRYLYKQLPQVLFIVAALPIPLFGLLFGILGLLVALAIAVGCLLALQPEHLALHDKLFKTAVFGPPTVQFTIPKASDILPTQSEIAAAQGRPAPAAPAASGPTPPPAA
jgi:uncharacterized RDD family membrane protein YckC